MKSSVEIGQFATDIIDKIEDMKTDIDKTLGDTAYDYMDLLDKVINIIIERSDLLKRLENE